VHPAGRGRSHF